MEKLSFDRNIVQVTMHQQPCTVSPGDKSTAVPSEPASAYCMPHPEVLTSCAQ